MCHYHNNFVKSTLDMVRKKRLTVPHTFFTMKCTTHVASITARSETEDVYYLRRGSVKKIHSSPSNTQAETSPKKGIRVRSLKTGFFFSLQLNFVLYCFTQLDPSLKNPFFLQKKKENESVDDLYHFGRIIMFGFGAKTWNGTVSVDRPSHVRI